MVRVVGVPHGQRHGVVDLALGPDVVAGLKTKPVAHLLAGPIEMGLQLGNHIGMVVGDIGRLADVGLEIVELEHLGLLLVGPAGLGDVKLPPADPDRFEIPALVVEERLMG